MSIRMGLSALALVLVLVGGCASTRPIDPEGQSSATQAQLFDGMGPYERKITTESLLAQHYFNQGLNWMYAFNHDEATRSFSRAAEVDPKCAMARWGISISRGPNYNDPIMDEERSQDSWDALQDALRLIDNGSPVERALIKALSHRYANPSPEDRTELNQAYADAMAEVWKNFPDDADVGTLYAEAMMIQTPWKLYDLDHTPAANTPTIVSVLERAMEIAPNNPGANHLYIHAVEPSSDPYRGLVAADRLSGLVPASGHLEHMPSHIYVKTGRWNRSIIQNAKAVRADDKYRSLAPEIGRQHSYMTHNAHMLAYSAMMSGREREAMAAARDMWSDLPSDALKKYGPRFDRWMCSIYDVQKRFGRWDDILSEGPPPLCLPTTNAMWRAQRAIAYAAKKDIESAELEYQEFKRLLAETPSDRMVGRDLARTLLQVSDYFIAGEIALQKGEWDQAAELLEQGAEIEDTLSYGEPPQWLQPIRHTLGAVYLKSGRFADAERVYREDLAKWPNNGWSLYGLSRALHGQNKSEEAREVEDQYRRAWARADAPIQTSCKCIPKT